MIIRGTTLVLRKSQHSILNMSPKVSLTLGFPFSQTIKLQYHNILKRYFCQFISTIIVTGPSLIE
jgi:hypothetical protein